MGNTPVVSNEQRAALASLSPLAREVGLHLVGGTAIALHLGHRRSADLDLFSRKPGLDLERVRVGLIKMLPRVQIIDISAVVLRARLGATPIDIVSYPYPPLSLPRRGTEGVPVAGLADLAAMKLAAIARRGLRRDFWDLHAITTGSRVGLGVAVRAYSRKFGTSEPDLYPVLQSLLFFDDAEAKPSMPRGLSTAGWAAIRQYFERAVPPMLRGRGL